MTENDINENIDVFYEKSKDGYDIIKLTIDGKAKYLGSKYNTGNDIDKIIEEIGEVKDFTTVFIIGLGTGEYIKKLKNIMNSTTRLVIIEPNENIFEKFKEYKIEGIRELFNEPKDKSDSLNPENLHILRYKEESTELISEIIYKSAFSPIKIIHHPVYASIFTKEIIKITELIRDGIRSSIFNRNTLAKFSKSWFESMVKNLKHLCNSISINKYKDVHKDIPAVIVSAGPSLDKNIKELKKAQGKFVIICGGRTLRPLIENGIIPNYMSIIDNSEESNALVLDLLEKYNIPLIHSEVISHKVLDKHKGKDIFYTYAELFNNIIKEKTENIAGGGSVAHSCTRFAAHCGCNPIIFIGQDLAYTDEKVHADNARFIQKKYADAENFDKVAGEMDRYVKDVFGGVVRTSQSLDSFRVALEYIIGENKDFKFINSTEGGANINGTEVKPLKETIEAYSDVPALQLQDYKGSGEILDKETVERVLSESISYFEKVSKKMKKAIELNEKLKAASRFKNGETDNITRKLDEIDDFVMNRDEKILFVEFLLAETIHQVVNDTKYVITGKETYKEKVEKIYNHGKLLYSGIYEQVEYALPILKEELEIIKNNK